MKKRYQFSVGLILGVLAGILIIVGLITLAIFIVAFGGLPEITTDIAKYEETMTKYSNVQTGFITFPETIPDSATDVDFYFFYQDTFDEPTCEVFLQCTYDEADYRAEVERLENTKKQYGSTERYLMKDEERFQYPAYIANDGHCWEFEHALLTGEREITYIFTAVFNKVALHKVDDKYLPSDYAAKLGTTEGLWDHYTIYLIGRDVIVGTESWSYDFTRDSVVAVEEFHSVSVDYNYFRVCTWLDEADNEIIQYCEYSYYESEEVAQSTLPESIEYEELKGYQYKSLELNEDKTIAIVTYYDGEEEKTWEYEIPDV